MWFKQNALLLIAVIFLFVGVPFAFFSCFQLVSTSNFLKIAVKTQAQVTDLVATYDNHGNRLYSPQVTFTTPDGISHQYQSTNASNPPEFRINQKIPIYFNPQNANDVKIDTFFDIWGMPLLFGGLGGVFIIIGFIFIIRTIVSRKNKEWLLKNGQIIMAEFAGLEGSAVVVNGESGYRIRCQWLNPANNLLYVFLSDDVWINPTAFITDKKVKVYINPANPKRYTVDLSFMPKLA
jgi:hypothetical protein